MFFSGLYVPMQILLCVFATTSHFTPPARRQADPGLRR